MFESLFGPEMAMKECRPDPQEMVDAAQSQLEILIKADKLLTEFIKLPIYLHNPEVDKALLLVFGHLRIRELEVKRDRERWLKKMN